MKRSLHRLIFSIVFVLLTILSGDGVLGSVQNEPAEEELHAVNERLKRAEDLARLGHWEIDAADGTIMFSDSVLTILGLSDKYITSEEFDQLLVPRFVKPRQKALKRLLEEGEIYDMEFQIKSGNGVILDIHSVGEYNRETNTVFGTLLDITERKAAERALARTHRRDIYIGVFLLPSLTSIVVALAVNIRNKKIAQARLKRNAKRNESLIHIFHKQTDTIAELAEFALSEAVSLTNSAGGCLCLYDEAQETFTLEVSSASLSLLNLKGEANPMLAAAREKRPIVDNDFRPGIVSRIVLIPISEKDNVVAVIGLVNKENDYTADDISEVSSMMETVWTMIARKQNSLLLKAEKNRLHTTLLSVGDAVITTDREGLVELMNPAAETLTGWFAWEAQGEPLERICSFSPGVHPIRHVLNLGRKFNLNGGQILRGRRDTRCEIAGSIAPIIDSKGEITGAVLVFRNVSAETQRLEQINFLTHHDQLTGLRNRQSFLTKLRQLAKKEQQPLSLLMGDINELKIINNAFGHSAGDKLLCRLADILRRNCRDKDIIGRWGGDEFVILLPKTGEYEALALARHLEDIFGKEKIKSVAVSASFGWATETSAAENPFALLQRAEKSMARSKASRKPSVSMETVQALMSALYEKSRREEQHSQRVSELCVAIGEELGLSAKEIKELKLIGLFHDLGKISIDGDILNKPGSLSEGEWVEIKRHPEIGYRILKSIPGLAKIAEVVLAHHERWDGSGYPRGLKGKQIPYQARIVAIADSYDAMVNERSYRIPVTRREALSEIKRCAKTHYDPEIVEAFLRIADNDQLTGGS